MKNDSSDRGHNGQDNATSSTPRDRVEDRKAASTGPSVDRRNVLLGTTALGAVAALSGSPREAGAQDTTTGRASSAAPAPAGNATAGPPNVKPPFKGTIKLDMRDS